MFRYAALFGIALRNNRKPLWQVSNSTVKRSFDITVEVHAGHQLANVNESTFVTVSEEHAYVYNNATEVLPDQNVTLTGYFQSRLYFSHAEEELRREFTFDREVTRRARLFIDTALPYSWIGSNFTIGRQQLNLIKS